MSTPTIVPTSIRISRLIKAPRARVFAAWTNANEIARWFAPSATHRMLEAKADVRVGGAYCLRVQPGDAEVKTITGVYQVVTPPLKLVFTWCGGCSNGESLVTVELFEKNGATEVQLTHERISSGEESEGFNKGWTAVLESLDTFICA